MAILVPREVIHLIYIQRVNLNNKKFYFHESTITNFVQQNHIITIDLEDVNDSNCIKHNLSISCIGVRKVEIDDKISKSVCMEADDGEVLTLEINPGSLLLIIEWSNYTSKKPIVKSYEIICEHVQVN